MASSWGLSWGTSWGNSWGVSTPVVVQTVDGGEGITEQHVRDLRKAIERDRQTQEKTYAQRRKDKADLRKALETAWEDVKDEAPAVFAEAAPEIDFERKKVNFAPLARDYDAVLRVIAELEARLSAQQALALKAQIAAAERQRQFEDDEAVALILLAA